MTYSQINPTKVGSFQKQKERWRKKYYMELNANTGKIVNLETILVVIVKCVRNLKLTNNYKTLMVSTHKPLNLNCSLTEKSLMCGSYGYVSGGVDVSGESTSFKCLKCNGTGIKRCKNGN
jgi:predicted RNA-binding Zn-ribbon protein involved in translation (DUF1610 family)